MKYLKRFNENNTNSYIEIDSNEFNDANWNKISISNNIIEKIKLMAIDTSYIVEMISKAIICIDGRNSGNLMIHIIEAEDEWFYMDVFDSSNNTTYYKCDQIEGIEDFLTNTGLI